MSEELRAEPGAAMAAIAGFLDVPAWQDETYRFRSVGEHEPIPPEMRQRLALELEPHKRRLEQLLGRRLPWTRPYSSS